MSKINLALPDDLQAQIDRLRGDVSRTRWIVRVLEREVERAEEYERMRRDGHAFAPPLRYHRGDLPGGETTPDLMANLAASLAPARSALGLGKGYTEPRPKGSK